MSDYEGGVLQASVYHGDLGQATALFNTKDLRRATVLYVRYPDEPRNRVTNSVTYDIVFHTPRMRRYNVPQLLPKAGQDSGEEVILHGALSSAEAAASFDPRTADLMKLDGDQVLVGFIDGNELQPVILGTITHPRNQYKGGKLKGERRYLKHKGAEVEIDNEGNVRVQVPDGKKVTIGDGNDQHPATWADNLRTELDAIWDAITTHTHTGVQTGGGTSGVTTTTATKQTISSSSTIIKG